MNACKCDLTTAQSESFFSLGTFDVSLVIISLVTLFLVHRLTRSREREKYVFEICKSIEGCAKEISDAAFNAWVKEPGAERLRSIALVLSQLQILGGLVNRLEILTKGWRMRWTFEGPGAVNAQIVLGKNLIKLRRSITNDPFNDPSRLSDDAQAVNCTAEVSLFVIELDLALRNWMRPY